MTWWQALLPATIIALSVRWVAIAFSEQYFSWIELFQEFGGDVGDSQRIRRQAMARRLLVPFAVVFISSLFMPTTYSLFNGAVVGALGAILLIWPMVFHGLPVGIFKSDWELAPIYGAFVALFASSATLGSGAALAVLEADSPVSHVIEMAGTLVLGFLAVGLFWSAYTWAASHLGRRAFSRLYEGGEIWEGDLGSPIEGDPQVGDPGEADSDWHDDAQ